jgi:hypothetical protein
MTLTEARAILSQAARNAVGDTYTDAQRDRAIQYIGEDLLLRTACVRSTGTVALLADTAAASASALTAFLPERLLHAWIGDSPDLEQVEHARVREWRTADATTGRPLGLAFTSGTALEVYPTPDTAYTLNLEWVPTFTAFTPGAGGDGVTLNIPDRILRPALWTGGVWALQRNDMDHQSLALAAKQEYDTLITSLRGLGGRGAKTIQLEKGQ